MKHKPAGTVEFVMALHGKKYKDAIKNKQYTEVKRFPGNRYGAENWYRDEQRRQGPGMIGVPQPTHGVVREWNGDGTSTFIVILFEKELWWIPR
ncbi:hypothetical protein [Deinococcus cellulosilyticus]|uniref:Uncharacterized protein n=1 Tax=Deinococcus cellulosilyticus (strain DSM 18568 / NBRC 106333 / KACC 11606 / 5516J-15) TaxID=1223518 RepID=A0A511N9Z4_DEIC1|nr:hypothetical protein [Deinococcus cellulosilyticus]GEM49645.1 hypothetical protein DC3_52800 [Deinococcus cellulosilyticus NBRC 106333 = KACC 11606]